MAHIKNNQLNNQKGFVCWSFAVRLNAHRLIELRHCCTEDEGFCSWAEIFLTEMAVAIERTVQQSIEHVFVLMRT